ncbi:MAG: DUF998 domain-containing protein [Bacillota bacterium]
MKPPFSAVLSPAFVGALAVLGVEFFLIVSVVLQFARSDYDWITMPLSFYLLGPYSGWLVAAYFTLAAGILLVGLGYYRDMARDARSGAPLLLFAAAAVSVAVVALAHTDTAEGPHPTAHGLVHNAAAALAFLSVTVAMLIQSWRLRYDARWKPYHVKAFLLAATTFATLWIYALWGALPRGLAQKIVILLIVLWLLMAGRWLMLTRLRETKP